jgi:phosphoserine aminotransferase
MSVPKPLQRPDRPYFSSGPCAKRPGWSVEVLSSTPVGRSHRAPIGKARLKKAIDDTHQLLNLPDNYRVGIVPASDTGAVEMALWSLLGPRPVDVFAWESFGREWVTDCVQQLKGLDVHPFVAPFGELPPLHQANFDHDVIFTWNGTTSGVIVPDGDWIPNHREGLTICDATSSVGAVPMPWEKLDVVTFSWQKVLGGEGAHGMLILSPRAVARLESHQPSWPIPKIFRLTKDGKLISGIFEGDTINTPSMLCVEDVLDALHWAQSIGGADGLARKTRDNASVIQGWINRTDWVTYLASHESVRSPTSVCLRAGPSLTAALPKLEDQAAHFRKITSLLDAESAAFDIGSYRDAPPGLRIWCGATVEASDLTCLTQWLDWAHACALNT